MTSRELVAKTIKGENTTGITPVYGWVSANLSEEISREYGSVQNFEDHYEFDMAHIFGGPAMYDRALLDEIRREEGEITPEKLLEVPFQPTDRAEDYEGVKKSLDFYGRDRERFCYIQSNGCLLYTSITLKRKPSVGRGNSAQKSWSLTRNESMCQSTKRTMRRRPFGIRTSASPWTT